MPRRKPTLTLYGSRVATIGELACALKEMEGRAKLAGQDLSMVAFQADVTLELDGEELTLNIDEDA